MIALATLKKQGLLYEDAQRALQQGHVWLNRMYHPYTRIDSNVWLGKELYAPYRVDRIYELSALLLTPVQEGNSAR